MKADEFLKKWEITPDAFDADDICRGFISEMERGLASSSGSSLSMIPAYCSDSARVVPGQSVIVLDAGGTNLRTCLVTFDDSFRPVISDFNKTRMPGFDREVTASQFFRALADETQRLMGKSSRIGFCFSYAASITEELDGIPIVFSKEIKAKDVVGKPIGKGLLDEFRSRGLDVSGYKVGVVNDTVATLLAGKAVSNGMQYSGYIGYILGTGTNTAYVEQVGNIGKLGSSAYATYADSRMIINMESGGFKADLGPLDAQFRAYTKNPGIHWFEKMISGAYLGPLARMVIGKAVDEGVLSSGFGDRFFKLDGLDTIQMSNYLEMPQNRSHALAGCVDGNSKDETQLYLILDSFIARAAKLTACNLASVALKSGAGRNPSRPICINADGTTFYKTKNLRRYTDFYLHDYLTARNGCHYDLVNINDSPIIGSAIAALTR